MSMYLSRFRAFLAKNPSISNPSGPARMAAVSGALGIALGISLTMWASSWPLGSDLSPCWAAFATCWLLFHFWEFSFNALFHPSSLSTTDFLLDHSRAFHIALAAAIIEFVVEALLLPTSFTSAVVHSRIWGFGLALTIGGQLLRTVSMCVAGSNFTHQIADSPSSSHELITYGPYRYSRHPGYAGWFAWAVGTQIVLLTPVCTVAYAVVAWRFFYERIAYEEQTLREMFGDDYTRYARRTPVGIPFLDAALERARPRHRN